MTSPRLIPLRVAARFLGRTATFLRLQSQAGCFVEIVTHNGVDHVREDDLIPWMRERPQWVGTRPMGVSA